VRKDEDQEKEQEKQPGFDWLMPGGSSPLERSVKPAEARYLARVSTVEELVHLYHPFADDGTLLLPADGQLSLGVERRLAIGIVGRGVVLRGLVLPQELVEGSSEGGAAMGGIRVRLVEVDPGSRVVQHLLVEAARRRRSQGSEGAPALADLHELLVAPDPDGDDTTGIRETFEVPTAKQKRPDALLAATRNPESPLPSPPPSTVERSPSPAAVRPASRLAPGVVAPGGTRAPSSEQKPVGLTPTPTPAPRAPSSEQKPVGSTTPPSAPAPRAPSSEQKPLRTPSVELRTLGTPLPPTRDNGSPLVAQARQAFAEVPEDMTLVGQLPSFDLAGGKDQARTPLSTPVVTSPAASPATPATPPLTPTPAPVVTPPPGKAGSLTARVSATEEPTRAAPLTARALASLSTRSLQSEAAIEAAVAETRAQTTPAPVPLPAAAPAAPPVAVASGEISSARPAAAESRLIPALLLCALGFALGFWVRGVLTPPPPPPGHVVPPPAASAAPPAPAPQAAPAPPVAPAPAPQENGEKTAPPHP
jgi:hypothetical protein